jgi:Helicase conserved C-terminal domain
MTVLSSTPNDMQLRAKLEEMVVNDLLGPATGPEEEISERNVHDRYLVGILAPHQQSQVPTTAVTPAPHTEDDDEEEAPSIPDELAESGDDTADDGKTDQDVPVAQAHYPSSIGMTFCVDLSAKAIKVEGTWGQYLRVEKEEGSKARIWKRKPRGGSFEIPLKHGTIQPKELDPEVDGVFVQGVIRKRDHHFVITLFLVNGQEEGRPKDQFLLFQPVLAITAPDGSAIFCKKLERRHSSDPATKLDEERMAMLYRCHVEFAVGHGVSVHADLAANCADQAVRVQTRIVPTYEVPKTTPPSPKDAASNAAFSKLGNVVLDMKELAETGADQVRKKLGALVTAYGEWIEAEDIKAKSGLEGLAEFKDAAGKTIDHCRSTLKRIDDGLKLLESDPQALEAFRFMNRAMWLQRTHSLYSEQVRRGGHPDFDKDIDVSANRTWYPFQIAFIILNLPGITLLDHPERSESQEALADLLFFPTGGGKTEGYLGLSAYTMGLRRLQGTVAGRSGENGIAVLMRYTLRLLTIQQFQRATALLCACESIRRKALEHGDDRWGKTPFRIGLWVGRKTTPNWTDDAGEAIKQIRGNQYGQSFAGLGSPYQLTTCPWCGSQIEAGRHLETRPYKQGTGRTYTFCGDQTGQCIFSKRHAPEEGLPVVVVDEEIYRRLPTMLIATVDKFAQMPWKGEVEMLFGMVNGFCTRHGFRSPEIEDASTHPATANGMPSAKTIETPFLRPPDLVIQDELHLISGPLGTLVGLYETAIDKLCTWEVGGKKVRPKVIASTATIKNAEVQVHALFLRKVSVFPPNGLDVSDNFFSLQREPSEEHPGRRYIGICAPGRRLKASLIRVYVAFLCSAQSLYEQYGAAIDPWMTLVGYFNSMRELGGMRRLVDDDVLSRCRKMDRRGLSRRLFYTNYLEELTSRMRSEQIPQTLDRLEATFDPQLAATRKEMMKGKQYKDAPKQPLDVLLATNMISVGVDVKRLGLMIVAGQPKSTAEYIQATSRVGRNKPGIVLTVFNWARPRDLSHYETFEHYHACFYKYVESLSVTPFAPGALSRGLAGLLVSLVRLRGTEFNSNESAARIQMSDPYIQDAIDTIAKRAAAVGDGQAVADFVRAELSSKVDLWRAEAQNTTGGRTLTYSQARGAGGPARGTTVSLLHRPGMERWEEFTCLNSLREVEPTVKLILDDGGLDERTTPETLPLVQSPVPVDGEEQP